MRDKEFKKLAEAAPMLYALARILCFAYCEGDKGHMEPYFGRLKDEEIAATWAALQQTLKAADMGPKELPELRLMLAYMDGQPEALGEAAYKALV